MTSFIRRTVRDAVTFEGLGLHSGAPVKAVIHPSSDGLVFVSGRTNTPAIPDNVTDTSRCTRLGDVSTIEHVMAALAAAGVMDATIEVQGGELPALDGAAHAFFRAILETGTHEIGNAAIDGPFTRIFHVDGDVKIAISKGEGHWRYEFELGARWPHSQHFEAMLDPEVFGREIAPARTFALEEEMEMVKQLGLGKGLDERSAFVIGKSDFLNPIKFPDEPARHKMLDLLGDLALSGVPYSVLNVVSSRGGHRANVAAAKKLRDSVRFIER